MNSNQKETDLKQSIDVVLEEMRAQRQMQNSTIDSLDVKAGILLGFESLLFVGLLSNQINSALSLIGFLLIAVSLLFLAWGLQLKKYKFNPCPDALVDDYLFRSATPAYDEKKASSKEQILVDQRSAYNHNKQSLDSKAFWIKVSLWILMSAIIVLGIGKLGGVTVTEENNRNTQNEQQIAAPNPAAENVREYTAHDKPAEANPNADNTMEKSFKPDKK